MNPIVFRFDEERPLVNANPKIVPSASLFEFLTFFSRPFLKRDAPCTPSREPEKADL